MVRIIPKQTNKNQSARFFPLSMMTSTLAAQMHNPTSPLVSFLHMSQRNTQTIRKFKQKKNSEREAPLPRLSEHVQVFLQLVERIYVNFKFDLTLCITFCSSHYSFKELERKLGYI